MSHSRIALAALIGLGISLAGSTAAEAAMGLTLSTTVGTDVSGSANSGSVNGSAQVSSEASAGADESMSDDRGMDSAQDQQEQGDAGVRAFTRSMLESGTDADLNLTDADDVRTSADLASFVQASMQQDKHLESADFSDDSSMNVTYTTDARLFGFIPSSMRVHVLAHDDGTVSVNYPWYAFLMGGVMAQDDLEASLALEHTGSWTDQDRARFVERVRAAFAADADASAT